jgi:hypothetical protein
VGEGARRPRYGDDGDVGVLDTLKKSVVSAEERVNGGFGSGKKTVVRDQWSVVRNRRQFIAATGFGHALF